MNINGFEISEENGRLHIDDGRWNGHESVVKFAERMGVNGGHWESFWDKWLERRNAAVEKALDAYFK